MKSKVLILTDKVFYSQNPQSIILNNIIDSLKKSKKIEITVFTTSKNIKKIKNIKFIKYNLDYKKFFYRFLDKIPLFNKYLFLNIKLKKEINKIINYVNENNISKILYFSNPYILNIISYFIKKKTNSKNIINYSDPIYNTIYKKHKKFIFRNFLIKYLEKRTLISADKIIFNNNKMKEFVLFNQSLKLTNKIKIIPHFFLKKDFLFKKKKKIKKKFINFSYFGSLNNIRNPYLLIKSILNLSKIKKISNCRFNFYGNKSLDIKKFIKDNYLELKINNIFFFDEIEYLDSIKKMQTSDILINIDAPNENIYLTTKIIYYLASKRPVLNITTKNSPNFKLGQEVKFFNAEANSQKNIENAIINSSRRYLKFKPNKKIIYKYEAKNVAKIWERELI